MTKLPLSIGILSWGQQKTLRNTLQSYKDFGLLDMAAQVFVFFQEWSNADIKVADEFGLEFAVSRTNLGIAGGYRAMLSQVEQPYYLFLENDWLLTAPPFFALEDGVKMLEHPSIADIVRYRSREFPGAPLWTMQFQGRELARPEHLLDCIHWTENPAESFPYYIERLKICPHEWYRTRAKYANWTNNPHMARTEWLKEVIAPRLGERDIELDLQSWWQEQNYRVVQGNGLFTHWRIG